MKKDIRKICQRKNQNLKKKIFSFLSKKILENLSKKIPENLPKTLSENLSKTIPENLSEMISENLSKTIPVPENLSQTIPENPHLYFVVAVHHGLGGCLEGRLLHVERPFGGRGLFGGRFIGHAFLAPNCRHTTRSGRIGLPL